jgi:hypothetical protein
VHLVGHSRDQGAQEVSSNPGCGFLIQLSKGKLAGAIDGDEQIKPPLFYVHMGDFDMGVADRVGLELFFAGLSPVTSGNRLMPRRCRHQCSGEPISAE